MQTEPFHQTSPAQDLDQVMVLVESIDEIEERAAERIELNIAAELTTLRGNIHHVAIRDMNRFGVGLRHPGPIMVGEALLRATSQLHDYQYRVMIEWCTPCGYGDFVSGGRILCKTVSAAVQ